jgi:Flp pilus assembly protein TadG
MLGLRRRGKAAPDAKPLLRRGAAWLGRLGREDGGTVVILAGFLFPVVIGGMGLGAETGYWYWIQRKVQHAADVAVYAAAVRMGQGDSHSDYEKVALHVAEEAGYIGGTAGLQVNSPPQAPSAFAGQADHVEVVLTESPSRLITSMFIDEPVTLTGRAVASVQVGTTGCVLALSKTAPSAVSLSGSTNVQLQSCDVASNSVAENAFNMQGSAKLTTGCLHSSGGASVTTGLTLTDEVNGVGQCKDGPNEYAPAAADPYAGVPNPLVESVPCANNKFVVSPQETTPIAATDSHSSGMLARCFGKGLDIKGTATFSPGLYFIQGGDFTINSTATVVGAGVTFVLLGGASLSFNGGASIDLTAPVPDPSNPNNPFQGILFFSDRNDSTASHTINGDASSSFTGAIYAPTTDVSYSGGGSTTGGCTQIIGDTVTFTGNSNVGSNCTGTGVADMRFGQIVAIVE